jgi:hypothetical protein
LFCYRKLLSAILGVKTLVITECTTTSSGFAVAVWTGKTCIDGNLLYPFSKKTPGK